MTRTSSVDLKVKRIYEPPAASDGCRVLVDRLWPRGVSREDAKLDGWIKEVAPSDELRKWFGHEPAKWDAFRHKYFRELDAQDGVRERVLGACSGDTATLLFAAKDSEHNNAVALKEYLDKRLK